MLAHILPVKYKLLQQPENNAHTAEYSPFVCVLGKNNEGRCGIIWVSPVMCGTEAKTQVKQGKQKGKISLRPNLYNTHSELHKVLPGHLIHLIKRSFPLKCNYQDTFQFSFNGG